MHWSLWSPVEKPRSDLSANNSAQSQRHRAVLAGGFRFRFGFGWNRNRNRVRFRAQLLAGFDPRFLPGRNRLCVGVLRFTPNLLENLCHFIHLQLDPTQWSTRWPQTEGLTVRTPPHIFAQLLIRLFALFIHFLAAHRPTLSLLWAWNRNRNRNRNRPVPRSEPNRTRFRGQPGTGQHCGRAQSQRSAEPRSSLPRR